MIRYVPGRTSTKRAALAALIAARPNTRAYTRTNPVGNVLDGPEGGTGAVELPQPPAPERDSTESGEVPMEEKSRGCVYFIETENQQFIKIGYTERIFTRFKALEQTLRPTPIRLLGYILGGPGSERFLHNLFATHRERGEWFRYTPEIVSFVASLELVQVDIARLTRKFIPKPLRPLRVPKPPRPVRVPVPKIEIPKKTIVPPPDPVIPDELKTKTTVTASEAAVMLALSHRQVRSLIFSRALPAYLTPYGYLIEVVDLALVKFGVRRGRGRPKKYL